MGERDVFEAHHAYVARGRLVAEKLRAPVFRAWERSHLGGADPLRLQAEHLSASDTKTLLDRRSDFIAAARPYMEALSRAAGDDRHAAMLGDDSGFVLDVVGDEESVHGATAVPGPGALLSEQVAGANGIGSPLAEGTYVELVAAEHFIAGFHPFTCQGIPIFDPDARVAGTISTSVRKPSAGQRIREILVCAAHGIEAELIRLQLEEDVRRVLSSGGLDEALMEKLRQDVVQSQTAARLKVEVAARDLSTNRLDLAMRLLGLAERSIAAFRRQGALWHELASFAVTAPRSVELNQLVSGLVELLATEAATGEIEVTLGEVEPITVEADAQDLARRLFRALLTAFDQARGGGAVRVDVRRLVGSSAEVRLTPFPPAGGARSLVASAPGGDGACRIEPIRLVVASSSSAPRAKVETS